MDWSPSISGALGCSEWFRREICLSSQKIFSSGRTKNFDDIYEDLNTGDIVQYVDKNGRTVHSQVVHKFKDGDVYMAQHSINDEDYYWGTDLRLSDWLDYGGAYVITIEIRK